jgi:DNA-binding MarR family transcriptional regulator
MLAGLHERGFTDLAAAHVDVWRYPGPENQRPSELATQTRMTKQALNYLLGQLEQFGYLTREADSDDQRSKRIRLTSRGRAATEAIYEIVQEVETEWEQQLGPRKFAQLRNLLTQLWRGGARAAAVGAKTPSQPARRSARQRVRTRSRPGPNQAGR